MSISYAGYATLRRFGMNEVDEVMDQSVTGVTAHDQINFTNRAYTYNNDGNLLTDDHQGMNSTSMIAMSDDLIEKSRSRSPKLLTGMFGLCNGHKAFNPQVTSPTIKTIHAYKNIIPSIKQWFSQVLAGHRQSRWV